ncbi:lipid IV(A) 4-amino-4-deoxy-L-arabinosyltransferase [Marinomonas spartinae]|uniref:lipid IV(A) 4-amino-4-deoxy-L-arabinosyltransferase n=1 Tax=Marinomonas spartinae TaxID=1792290 RepID=UPI0018F2055D|nr:lipid IV(A) 4-amino-4-deoxy-L-arabinosyltransferase [Marinomonas spartinae]MBJ7556014.1 lipid IV(A) 4-amino-4-deoxy-L-arabinosyltransferase [Marinomonas spartinae]
MRPVPYKWILVFGFALLYLLPLGWHPLWMPDETRYAEISREMLASGNWVVPHFMGLHYFEKPILGYWMNNISQLLFGHTNFAARFMPALSIGLAALITYQFVKIVLKDQRKAFYSALVYLSCPLVFGVGTYNALDGQLTFWMAASFASFYYATQAQTRQALAWRYLLFGAFGGAVFLTKGFVGLALLVIALVPFMILTRQFKQVLVYGLLAILAAVLVALPWSLAVALKAPDYWHFFFWNENIRRFDASNAQHLRPFWFYLPVLLLAVFPWTFLAPKAILRNFTDKTHKHFFLYQVLCFVLPFLLLSIAKGKLPTYIAPLMMPLAILMGCGLVELLKEKHRAIKFSVWGNALGFGGFGLVLLLMQFNVVGKVEGYGPHEIMRFWLGMAILFGCALVPLLGLINIKRAPMLLALAPMALFILLPLALPMKVVNSKLPEVFFSQYVQKVQPDAWVLCNSVALIGGIGWELKRSDIDLLNGTGELSYGLDHSSKKRRYTYQEFRDDLPKKRQSQQVVLALETDKDSAKLLARLPVPTEQYHAGRFYLLVYAKQP